jgi:hypothetical protein
MATDSLMTRALSFLVNELCAAAATNTQWDGATNVFCVVTNAVLE